jgi:hypothetical protein
MTLSVALGTVVAVYALTYVPDLVAYVKGVFRRPARPPEPATLPTGRVSG